MHQQRATPSTGEQVGASNTRLNINRIQKYITSGTKIESFAITGRVCCNWCCKTRLFKRTQGLHSCVPQIVLAVQCRTSTTNKYDARKHVRLYVKAIIHAYLEMFSGEMCGLARPSLRRLTFPVRPEGGAASYLCPLRFFC
eukprot:1727270-Pyramimonas_sp.AAC.1